MLANRDAAKDGRAGPDAGALLDQGRNDLPVAATHQAAVGIDRTRVLVVGKTNMRADEDTIFERNSLGNECKRLDFHISPNLSGAPNLHKCANLTAVANFTPVEIDQVRVINHHILPHLDIGGDHGTSTSVPKIDSDSPAQAREAR